MTSEIEKQVASVLLDEEKCASVSGMSFQFSQNRQQAATALEKVLHEKHSDERKFTVTKCVVSEEQQEQVPCTGTSRCVHTLISTRFFPASRSPTSFSLIRSVFKLEKQDFVADAMEQDDAFLYAASTENGESISTGHERDMTAFRTKLQDNQLPPCAKQLLIEPSPHLPAIPVGDDSDMKYATLAAPTTTATRKKGKATTANDFFKSKSKGAVAEDGKENNAKEKARTSTNTAVAKKPAASKKQAPKISATANPAQKKPTAASKPSENKKIGNADDFVGDVDDSDDEEDTMDVDDGSNDSVEVIEKVSSKKTSKPAAKKAAAKKRAPLQDSDDDEESDGEEKDAMDEDAAPKKKKELAPPTHRPRRKKMVEKTYVDCHGYLVSETVEEWEDIPEEELKQEAEQKKVASQAQPKPAAKKKSKAAAGKPKLKQGNIMGFFQKK